MDSKRWSKNDILWQSHQHFKQKAKLDSDLCRFANLFFWHWLAINLVTTSIPQPKIPLSPNEHTISTSNICQPICTPAGIAAPRMERSERCRWQKNKWDILLCLHQPNPQLGHHPALDQRDFDLAAAREAVLYLMMLLFDLGMIWGWIKEIFHQAEMLRPSVWSLIWGDYHSPSCSVPSLSVTLNTKRPWPYRYISWLMVQQTRTDFEIQASVSFFILITCSTRLHVVHNEHSACLWRHLRNKAWPDQMFFHHIRKMTPRVSATVLPCTFSQSPPVQLPGQPHCRDAFVLSFLSFVSFPSAQGPGDGEPTVSRAKRIHGTVFSSATLKWWNMWLVQLHSDKEHGMPTIFMSCDAKDVSPKTLMKLYETTQMSRRLC